MSAWPTTTSAERDPRHRRSGRCSQQQLSFRTQLPATAPGRRGLLVVPPLVIAEAGFLIERELGPTAEASFLRSLAHPRFRVETVHPDDLERMAELVGQYDDLPLGATDASVIALAERLNEREVATLDRRHFTVVRPRHVDSLTLLP